MGPGAGFSSVRNLRGGTGGAHGGRGSPPLYGLESSFAYDSFDDPKQLGSGGGNQGGSGGGEDEQW